MLVNVQAGLQQSTRIRKSQVDKIKVFPNPSAGRFMCELDLPTSCELVIENLFNKR